MLYILLTLASFQNPVPRPDSSEIMKVLEGLHSPFKDVEFVCEGETKWLVDTTDLFRGVPDRQSGRFQGAYAYRDDGAAYWDSYFKPFDSRRILSTILSLNSTIVVRQSFVLLTVRAGTNPLTSDPVLPTMGLHSSPQLFIYLGYWRRIGYSTKDIEIESIDWDEVNGNRALRLTVNEYPNVSPKSPPANKVRSKYWIDLKRGGHVLKHERYRGSNLIGRTDKVVLASLQSSRGQQIWLPIHAEFDTFWWLKGYSETPLFHETYNVVRGSVVLNSGLTDERFSVEWKGHKAETAQLKRARQEFASTPRAPETPRLRTDPAGVPGIPRAAARGSGPPGQATRRISFLAAWMGFGHRSPGESGRSWRRHSHRRFHHEASRFMNGIVTSRLTRCAALFWITSSYGPGAWADEIVRPLTSRNTIVGRSPWTRCSRSKAEQPTSTPCEHDCPPRSTGTFDGRAQRCYRACGISLVGIKLSATPAPDRPVLVFLNRDEHGHFLVVRPWVIPAS